MSEEPTADSRIHLAANLIVALGPAAVGIYLLWSRLHVAVFWKSACTVLVVLVALVAAHRLAPRITDAPVERLFGRRKPPGR